jgi:hypothetical protein
MDGQDAESVAKDIQHASRTKSFEGKEFVQGAGSDDVKQRNSRTKGKGKNKQQIEVPTASNQSERSQGRLKPQQKGSGKMRGREQDSPEVRLSKTLSWLLRHGAQGEGLAMRPDGYVKVTDLVSPIISEICPSF